MVMPNQQQQGGTRVFPCYDDLIAFLKEWFAKTAPILEKPILELNRYTGNSNQWQKVVSWKVASNARGLLAELSMICDNYTPLAVWVKIAGKEVKAKSLQSALTIPYNPDLRLIPNAVIEIYCKSNGVDIINFDATIVGREVFIA